VHLLADESARNMAQMAHTDPGWARLLAQGDRRVVVNNQALADMLQGKLPAGSGAAEEDVQALRAVMHEVISAWWADEPEDLREDLRDALQVSRGIPQEVDRQLLLRMRQKLIRALSWSEKKMLRETLRAEVLGPAPATAASADAAGSVPSSVGVGAPGTRQPASCILIRPSASPICVRLAAASRPALTNSRCGSLRLSRCTSVRELSSKESSSSAWRMAASGWPRRGACSMLCNPTS
jgi:hypothetical protein